MSGMGYVTFRSQCLNYSGAVRVSNLCSWRGRQPVPYTRSIPYLKCIEQGSFIVHISVLPKFCWHTQQAWGVGVYSWQCACGVDFPSVTWYLCWWADVWSQVVRGSWHLSVQLNQLVKVHVLQILILICIIKTNHCINQTASAIELSCSISGVLREPYEFNYCN